MATILFLGGDMRARAMVSEELGFSGYDVAIADTCRGALTALRGRTDVAAIVVDQHLADATGLDLVPGLRERLPDAVIVLTASHLDDQMAVTLLTSGVTAVVPTPFDPSELARALRRLVGRRTPAPGVLVAQN